MSRYLRHVNIRHVVDKLGNSFSGRASLVLLGSAIGQAVAFALLPVLAQLYPPDVLGRAATTLAVLGVITLLASLQFDQAVIVSTDRDLPYLLLLACCIVLGWMVLLSALLLGLSILWPTGQELLHSFGVNLYLILLLWGSSIFVLLTNYHLRCNQLRQVSTGRVIYYGGGAILQVLGAYMLRGNETVFLMAQFVAALGAICFLMPYSRVFRWLRRHRGSIGAAHREVLRVARVYSEFPKYQAGAQLLNTLSVQLPVIIMRMAFSDVWAGWFFLTYRLLAVPTTMLSQAVGQVFYRDSAERERMGSLRGRDLERVVIGLVQISLLPAIAVGAAAPFLVETFLSPEWAPVALILQILLIPFVVAFFVSPISALLNVKNRQKGALFFNGLLFLGRIGALLLAWQISNPWAAVWYYAIASAAVYLPFFVYVAQSVNASVMSMLSRLRYLLLDVGVILILVVALALVGWLNQWVGVVLTSGITVLAAQREFRRTRSGFYRRTVSEIGGHVL